jgi:hypothetical protein
MRDAFSLLERPRREDGREVRRGPLGVRVKSGSVGGASLWVLRESGARRGACCDTN